MKNYKMLSVPKDSAWERFTIRRYLPIWLLEVTDGIANIFAWLPTIYKDRHWDSSYIYEVLKKKIELQRKYIVSSNRHLSVPTDNYFMTVCLNLIERCQSDYYAIEYLDYHTSKFDFIPCNEDGEEDAAVLRHSALLADVVGGDAHQGIVGEGREGVVGLVGQDVAVGEEQDPLLAAGLPQPPDDLEGGVGLASAARHDELATVCVLQANCHVGNGFALVVTYLLALFERDLFFLCVVSPINLAVLKRNEVNDVDGLIATLHRFDDVVTGFVAGHEQHRICKWRFTRRTQEAVNAIALFNLGIFGIELGLDCKDAGIVGNVFNGNQVNASIALWVCIAQAHPVLAPFFPQVHLATEHVPIKWFV